MGDCGIHEPPHGLLPGRQTSGKLWSGLVRPFKCGAGSRDEQIRLPHSLSPTEAERDDGLRMEENSILVEIGRDRSRQVEIGRVGGGVELELS